MKDNYSTLRFIDLIKTVLLNRLVMDSLCFASEGKELLFPDDIEFPDFNNNLLVPIKEGDGETEFTVSDLPNTTRKSFLDDLSWRVSTNDSSNTNIFNPFSRFPTSSIRPRDHTLPKIDSTRLSREKSASSSPESLLTPKRLRNTNLQTQLPVCQVQGCNKDLSLSKDYHKRHRVCDVHSKTAVVIVNGVQQRFCQQCSRFHVLAEFDEGKRSCRERLAGHNKRRRKLQLDTRLGPLFFGEDLSRTSFFLSGILPGSFFPQQSIKRLKHEQELTHIPVKFWQSCAKSLKYPSGNCLNSPLSFQELSWGSNSGCALSFLSDQSHKSLSNSAGTSMANSTRVSKDVADKDYRSVEVAKTVNLVELSFCLQRVEQQRNSTMVKQENDMFCCSTII